MNKALYLLLVPLLLAGAVSIAQAQAQAQAPAQGSAADGEKKAAMCIGCHGLPRFQASFPEVYKVPMISGQNGKYIVAALTAYKKGERKHPTMRGIAGSLTDQDMADLAAYYEGHGAAGVKPVADAAPQAAPAEVAALLTKGACASCHGANFSKPIDPGFPKIGGQHGDYLAAALRAYATEGNPKIGRGNPVMVAQVKQFKRAELKAIAEYLETLPGDLRTVSQPRFRW